VRTGSNRVAVGAAAVIAILTFIAAFSPAQQSTPSSMPPATDTPTQASPPNAIPSPQNSKSRAARLSEVKGDVALDRNIGAGFEHAFANIPLTERCRIQTGIGRAEVEFEDNSTLRLAPYSLIEFSRLELLPSGAKASTVNVLKGTAYISLIPAYIVNSRGNDFLVTFGKEELHLLPSSHVRLELEPTEAQVVDLDGPGQIDGPFGTIKLTKKKTIIFNLSNQSEPQVVKKVKPIPQDNWDRWSTEYHQRTASMQHSSDKKSATQKSSRLRHDIFH
jgi:hypothetical protein